MNSPKPELLEINEADRTPLVDALLEVIAWQQKQIDTLEQNILKLKGETIKPKIKPSSMDKGGRSENDAPTSKKKKGPKHSKPSTLS